MSCVKGDESMPFGLHQSFISDVGGPSARGIPGGGHVLIEQTRKWG